MIDRNGLGARVRLAAVTAATAALLATVAACVDGGSAMRVERADSAGVRVVTTYGADVPLEWRFEERFSLGGADEGPESFFALSRSLVATDDDGAIYVLDRTAQRVEVFDSGGGHLTTYGREGSGPGELEMPAGVAVSPDGAIGVWDYGKSGLVRFGAGGEPLATFPSSAFYGGRGLQLRATGAVYTTTDLRDPESSRDALVLLDTAAAGEEGWPHLTTIVGIPQPASPMHDFSECGLRMRLPPLFYPDVEWAPGPDGRLYVNAAVELTVDVYEDTLLTASYRRALDPRPANRELALESVGEGMTVSVGGGAPCTVPAERVVDSRGYADEVPFVESLAVDPAGRVWVERVRIGDEPVALDVFSRDGAYVGTLTGAPVPVAFLPNGDVLAVETNELDVDQLIVYRVEEDPAG